MPLGTQTDRRVQRGSATKASPERKLMSLFGGSRNTTGENSTFNSVGLGGDNTFGYRVALVSVDPLPSVENTTPILEVTERSDEMHDH